MTEHDNSPPDDLMTLTEVLEYWGVTRNTARKYIEQYNIQKFHILGKGMRYSKREIEDAAKPRQLSDN